MTTHAARPPALPAPAAFSSPSAHPTSPGASRRGVLSGLAAALGLGAAANLTAIAVTRSAPLAETVSQIIPAIVENPELIDLDVRLDQAMAVFDMACEDRKAAHARFDAACPKVPQDLIYKDTTSYPFVPDRSIVRDETDVDGGYLYLASDGRVRGIFRACGLRDALYSLDGRTRAAREVRRLLSLAERHERAVSRSETRSRIHKAIWQTIRAQEDVLRIVKAIIGVEAITMEGVTIKARALQSALRASNLLTDWPYYDLGDQLASAVLRLEGATLPAVSDALTQLRAAS